MKPIPPSVTEALAFVFGYASHVDNWRVIKRELFKVLPPVDRGLFAIRDLKTLQPQYNDFERELAQRWSEMTGRPVLFT